MNTLESKNAKQMMKSWILPLLVGLCLLSACKQTEDLYIYEVNNVEVNQADVEKVNLKTDLEFVSIVYSDLFGSTLPAEELSQLVRTYNSMGDKKLVEDMIIKDLLTRSDVDMPTSADMFADSEQFVKDTYKRFYTRVPSEYELWFLKN